MKTIAILPARGQSKQKKPVCESYRCCLEQTHKIQKKKNFVLQQQAI